MKSENKGNSNLYSKWNLPIGAWNMTFKTIDLLSTSHVVSVACYSSRGCPSRTMQVFLFDIVLYFQGVSLTSCISHSNPCNVIYNENIDNGCTFLEKGSWNEREKSKLVSSVKNLQNFVKFYFQTWNLLISKFLCPTCHPSQYILI